ncbi:ATP-binding protein [Xylocopilactobacillus apis]|uniref:ATPase AAA n=1 Tax=Xylocopilactobacillus apis TaxID=2932183 RepID=A0AAU9D3G3_9LACO|nr:AAA family ATPase [Xylocopilactobacillus apis]BDR56840.1 ATPase AAA [Xylocopilactobacillus apis]
MKSANAYQKRIIDQLLKRNLEELPAILIEGAKAVGKTETCLQLAKTVYDLDNESIRLLLKNSPEIILNNEIPVLIDEWQLLPEVWSFVRHQVDQGLPAGSVLFTGSSIKVNSRIHSGAGRIIRMTLRPFSIEERQMSDRYLRVGDLLEMNQEQKISGITDKTLTDYLDEIFRSGFPGIRNKSEHARHLLLQSYVNNIVDHDFQENGFMIKKPESLLSWIKSYAAAIGTTTKFQTIWQAAMANNSESASRKTIEYYHEALKILDIIDEVPSFLPVGKIYSNLARAPKHFMLDPAIALEILGVDQAQLVNYKVPSYIGIFNQSFIGQLLESLVYQSLIVYAEANDAKLSHFRNHTGTHEVDFIIQKQNHLILFEVKADPEAKDSYVKHLNWFEELVKGEFEVTKVLLNTGKVAYTRNQDHVHVIPISMIGS